MCNPKKKWKNKFKNKPQPNKYINVHATSPVVKDSPPRNIIKNEATPKGPPGKKRDKSVRDDKKKASPKILASVLSDLPDGSIRTIKLPKGRLMPMTEDSFRFKWTEHRDSVNKALLDIKQKVQLPAEEKPSSSVNSAQLTTKPVAIPPKGSKSRTRLSRVAPNPSSDANKTKIESLKLDQIKAMVNLNSEIQAQEKKTRTRSKFTISIDGQEKRPQARHRSSRSSVRSFGTPKKRSSRRVSNSSITSSTRLRRITPSTLTSSTPSISSFSSQSSAVLSPASPSPSLKSTIKGEWDKRITRPDSPTCQTPSSKRHVSTSAAEQSSETTSAAPNSSSIARMQSNKSNTEINNLSAMTQSQQSLFNVFKSPEAVSIHPSSTEIPSDPDDITQVQTSSSQESDIADKPKTHPDDDDLEP